MNIIKNLNKVSAFYFFLIAFIYVASALYFRSDLYVDLTTVIMRIMDIPLALTALIYSGSTIYLQISEGRQYGAPLWGIIIFTICLIIFGVVVFINFALPGKF